MRFSLTVMLLCVLGACASSSDAFSAKGTVQSIERGKDGYTAVLANQKGQRFNAVISRVNMAATKAYQELAVGEKVTVYGDTTRYGEVISIKVSQIKK
ncbi:hypothetical protein [Pontibacter harenae]|uniref:hypothetical protein n=1 Tax=Pontibacter harenae TaxID=2894083 RepID=UPI001E5CC85A|nr:hypothetical protein [Pontibacter harenae]MCC9169195.1 hypothetical protein [Pontibacter harenae]